MKDWLYNLWNQIGAEEKIDRADCEVKLLTPTTTPRVILNKLREVVNVPNNVVHLTLELETGCVPTITCTYYPEVKKDDV